MDSTMNKEKEEKEENEINNSPSKTREEFQEKKSWDDYDIPLDLLRGVYAYGFEKPSPIQSRAIEPIVKGRDVIGQSQSGCGKTGAFSISALALLNMELNTSQVIILSPTRELAIQNANVVKALGSMMNGLKVMTLVGGSSIDEDIHTLKKNPPHIISGCPGRVYDMFRRRCIPTQHLKLLILDEADEMLSTGFKEQVQSLFQHLPETMQVALFSATLPQSIHDISKKIMRNPVEIFVKAESLTLEGISQFYVAVQDDRQKYETLKDIFSFISMSQCIIYCNTVQRVMDLYDSMTKDQFPVCCIHSNMDKTEREKAFNEFLTGKHRVLISSNVTARGIDIQQVSVVINFDLPNCVHTYLHRIGRSGRWGRKGVSINFITRRDMEKIREIETFYSTQIKELTSNLDTLFT